MDSLLRPHLHEQCPVPLLSHRRKKAVLRAIHFLNTNDFRPHVPEQGRTKRPGDITPEIKHPNALQNLAHVFTSRSGQAPINGPVSEYASSDFQRTDGAQGISMLARCQFQFVVVLQVHPASGVGFKVSRQSQCRLGRNAPAPTNYLINAPWRYSDRFRQRAGRQRKWLHEVMLQNLTWMNWLQSRHHSVGQACAGPPAQC